jgi:lipid-A-disaccharide synthase
MNGANAQIMYDQTLAVLKIATAAVVTSGTATLETGLIGTPQVVCYKTAPLSYAIARLLIRVRFISLVNLILDRLLVDELIQRKCTVIHLEESLSAILSDHRRIGEITRGYGELDRELDSPDAPAIAASVICQLAMPT